MRRDAGGARIDAQLDEDAGALEHGHGRAGARSVREAEAPELVPQRPARFVLGQGMRAAGDQPRGQRAKIVEGDRLLAREPMQLGVVGGMGRRAEAGGVRDERLGAGEVAALERQRQSRLMARIQHVAGRRLDWRSFLALDEGVLIVEQERTQKWRRRLDPQLGRVDRLRVRRVGIVAEVVEHDRAGLVVGLDAIDGEVAAARALRAGREIEERAPAGGDAPALRRHRFLGARAGQCARLGGRDHAKWDRSKLRHGWCALGERRDQQCQRDGGRARIHRLARLDHDRMRA